MYPSAALELYELSDSPIMQIFHVKCIFVCVALIIVGAYGLSKKSTVQSAHVQGNVVEIDRAYNDVYGLIESRVTVEYTVDDVVYKRLINTSTTSNIFKGDTLDLVYDPIKPDAAAFENLESASSSESLNWMMLITGLIMLVSKAL